jgi:5-methyltetrahydrofolate--homocysteine methyltransferase
MTFDTRGHTMMGVAPETAAEALTALGVDAIGGNCGNGPDELLPVIERMRAVAPDTPLVAKPNIGIPVFVGARAEYRTTPETMAGEAASLRAAGATVIGACCGSTPAHLAAMAAALGDN